MDQYGPMAAVPSTATISCLSAINAPPANAIRSSSTGDKKAYSSATEKRAQRERGRSRRGGERNRLIDRRVEFETGSVSRNESCPSPVRSGRSGYSVGCY